MNYEPTVVLEKDYLEKARTAPAEPRAPAPERRPAPRPPLGEDPGSTRVISKHLVVDGVKFSWWAVDDSPALVTVRNPLFGSKAELTREDVEAFATRLAKSVLAEHFERVAQRRQEREAGPPATNAEALLNKPGWFDCRRDG